MIAIIIYIIYFQAKRKVNEKIDLFLLLNLNLFYLIPFSFNYKLVI